MRTIKKSQKVMTLVDSTNYYRNGTPEHYYGPAVMTAGSVGVIGAVGVPCVRLRATCRCQTFVCVDFPDGARAAYHKHEIKGVK